MFIPAPSDTASRGPAAPPGAPRRAPTQSPPEPPARPPRRTTTPTAAPSPRRRRRFPRLRWIALALVLLLVAGGIGSYFWAQSIFNRVERVPVGDVLSTGGSGTNYLLVGSDTREGISADDPTAGAFLDDGGTGGQRSDTMLVLHLEGGKASMLSIPRDLYVTIAETGQQQKINAAFNGGPTRLIKTIQQNLQIPIHRYIEVDFVSFAGLVDALGGVTINFPKPAFDAHSGLDVRLYGNVELDGEQALAYVRSRNYTERLKGGGTKTDFTADLGRIKRQQAFLRSVMSELGDTKNPFTLGRVASRMADGLRIDDRMTMWQALRFAWALRGLEPKSIELPAEGARNGAGAVLIMRTAEAKPVLDQFR